MSHTQSFDFDVFLQPTHVTTHHICIQLVSFSLSHIHMQTHNHTRMHTNSYNHTHIEKLLEFKTFIAITCI